jgi:hypothetical protein
MKVENFKKILIIFGYLLEEAIVEILNFSNQFFWGEFGPCFPQRDHPLFGLKSIFCLSPPSHRISPQKEMQLHICKENVKIKHIEEDEGKINGC